MKQKYLLPLHLILVICLVSCTTKASSGVHEEVPTDIICESPNQSLLDSLYSNGNIHYANSALYNSGIQGRVKSISIPFDENSLYFRFDYIEFYKDGTISTIESNNERLEHLTIDVDNSNSVISADFDETICLSSFCFDLSKKTSKSFNYNAEGFDLTYTFEYSPNGELKKIMKVQKEMHYEIEGAEPTEEMEVFDVKVLQKDAKGNWTRIAITSPNSSQTVSRHIQYYEDLNEVPTLIETNSNDKIFFAVANEYDNQFMRYYDRNTGIVHKIIPPDYEDNELYGYKSYKFVGDKLYLVFLTGASGALAYNMDCEVYSYNIRTGEWNEISYCGYECEIVENKIKMPFYNPDTNQTEIEWYEMK